MDSYPAGPTPYNISGKGLILGTEALHGQHLFDTLCYISYCTDKELCSKHAREKLVLHSSSTPYNKTTVHCIQLCFIILASKICVLKSE